MSSTKTSFYATPQDLERMAQLAKWWELPAERFNGGVISKAIEMAYDIEQKNHIPCEDCGNAMTYLKFANSWVCEWCDID